MGSHKKFGPDRFSRFDVYWIQTNKQAPKQNLYIDERYASSGSRDIGIRKLRLVVKTQFLFNEFKKCK